MTRHPPVALLVLGAAVLVAAGVWWLTDNTPLDDRATSAHEAVPSKPSLPTETEGTIAEHPPPSTEKPPPEVDHNADDGFSAQGLWAHISDPANSDLPPELFTELSQLGGDIVRADATGQGRDRWPDYWSADEGHSGSRAERCCTDITIHAAGAYTHPVDPNAVQVTVIWTGVSAHEDLVEQVAQLYLRPSPHGWQPF